jgi:hypothetical protein
MSFVNIENPTWWQQALQDASNRIEHLEAELAAVRDIAYRAGDAGAVDALQAIHQRACRALNEEY